MRLRLPLLATTIATVLFAALASLGAQAPATDDTPFAYPDRLLWPGGGSATQQRQARAVQRTAAERLSRFPDSPHTVAWLSQARRLGDALDVLARVIEQRPERLSDALVGLDTSEIRSDQSRGYRTRARTLLAEATRKLSTLDRERAADVAVALFPLEQATADVHEEYDARLDRFLAAYAGTEATRLAEVDRLARGPLTLERLSALDEIAARSPGTVVAAKARYMKGFQLARNWSNFVLYGANPDPTDSFLDLLAVVADLESGRYPPCTWVDQAPELVTGYSMFNPKISRGNAARMLDGIRQFVRTHPALLATTRPNRSPNFLITNLMPTIAAFLPDGAAVMERQFVEFEREWPDPAAARLLRATWLDAHKGSFLAAAALPPPSTTREADMRALLALAATSPTEVYARQALARLAEREFADPASLAAAHAHYREYERRFAAAPDAWIAALRVGQVERAQGRANEAVASFVRASETYSTDAYVGALALAYAGRVSEESGAFEAAGKHYRASLDAWETELGDTLSLDLPIARDRAGEAFGNPLYVNRAAVQRPVLQRRVAEIGHSLSVAGGAELERGRWLLAEGRSADAVRILEDVAGRYATSSVGAEARTIVRRARLDAAVARATSPGGARDVTAALGDLDRLAREPFDATSGVAGVVAATIRLLQGQRDDADSGLTVTLRRWVAGGATQGAAPDANSLEADVLAVRDAVFLPLGNAILGSRWNAAEWRRSFRHS